MSLSGPSDITTTERRGAAEQTVKRYMITSLAVGLVPVPIVDMAALTAIQLQMLSRLAKRYDVEFSEQLATSVVGSLVGAGSSTLVTTSSHHLLARLLPPLWLVGATTVAVFAGAATYAVGRTFIQHFESGGTFLTFDPEKVRQYYAEQLDAGAEEVTRTFAGVKP